MPTFESSDLPPGYMRGLDDRVAFIKNSFLDHIADFVKEVNLVNEEWHLCVEMVKQIARRHCAHYESDTDPDGASAAKGQHTKHAADYEEYEIVEREDAVAKSSKTSAKGKLAGSSKASASSNLDESTKSTVSAIRAATAESVTSTASMAEQVVINSKDMFSGAFH